MCFSIWASCSSSMNTATSPTSLKSNSEARNVADLMRWSPPGREIGEHSCRQNTADAESENVDLALAGRLLDRIERGERPFEHVVLEILAREVGARVDPGDHERGVPLIDAPFDEAVLRLQIEDVELVDPGRHEQERTLVHLRGGRRVLDQLHQIVLVDHLAGRGGDVLADLERLLVGHADLQAPSAPLEVGEQMLEAVQQVLAAGLLGFAQDRRIGQDEVARRDRADELPGVEVDLLLVLGIEPGDVADQRAQPAGAEQVRLPDVIEQKILGPGLVLEAPVAALGRDQGSGGRALHALQRVLPELRLIAPQLELGLDQPPRVSEQPGAELEERAADDVRVAHRIAGLAGRLGLIAPELLHDVLAALGELGEPSGQRGVLGIARLAHEPSSMLFQSDRRQRCDATADS